MIIPGHLFCNFSQFVFGCLPRDLYDTKLSLRYTFWKLRVLQNLYVYVPVCHFWFKIQVQVMSCPLPIWLFMLGNGANFTARGL